jgi:hypothetical protein
LHCAVTYQVSVSSCCAFSCNCRSARRYIRKGAHLLQVLVNTSEHTAVGSSSSRMSEPVFFHAVENRTPSEYRFILHDKTAFVQFCVTVCLLQDLRTALNTVSCITGAVIIDSMNTSVTAFISCCKISNRCDFYPCDYDTSNSELAVELDCTV